MEETNEDSKNDHTQRTRHLIKKSYALREQALVLHARMDELMVLRSALLNTKSTKEKKQ